MAFPYLPGAHNLAGVVPAVLGRRVDTTWGTLGGGKWNAVVDKAASSTLIAVTNRRIITASPRILLLRGELGESYALSQVRFVRRPTQENTKIRPTVDVITEQQDLRWMFPAAADAATIDDLVALIRTTEEVEQGNRAEIGELPE